jgi:membrane protease YdiL (CAAX protease family)
MRPRGLWLAALIVLLLTVADILAAELLYNFGLYYYRTDPTLIEGGLGMTFFYLPITLIYLGYVRWRDARPFVAYGLTREGWRDIGPWLLFGLAVGAPGIAESLVKVGDTGPLGYALWAMLLGAPFFLFPAAFEEIFFRGWLMQTIAARHGGLIALWGSSLIFGAWHLDMSGSSLNALLSVLFRIPAGLALGLIALRGRNLWAAIGAHTGWNAAYHGAVAVVAAEDGLSPWDETYNVGAETVLTDMTDPFFLFGVAHTLAPLAVMLWLARGEHAQLLRDSKLFERRL